MNQVKLATTACVLCTFLSITLDRANANLIVGGGFNSLSDLTDNWTTGGSSIPTVTVGTAFGLGPQAGAGYLAFTGNGASENGFAEQTISVTPELTHTLGFYYGTRGLVGGSVTASITESVFGDLGSTQFSAGTVGVWEFATLTFVPSSSSVTVRFQESSATSVGRGPGVDTVSLIASPEPSTAVLSFLGLLSLNFVGWRRRRR